MNENRRALLTTPVLNYLIFVLRLGKLSWPEREGGKKTSLQKAKKKKKKHSALKSTVFLIVSLIYTYC